jgi:ABC-type uncharacterized transport system permease subunit
MPLLTDRSWLWFATALYLAGFTLGTVALARDRKHSRGLMYALICAGFGVQTFGLYLRGLAVRGCPIGNLFETFQFTAWSATALYLMIGATFRLSLLGYFTSCLSATLTVVSLTIRAWDATRRVDTFGGNPWIEFHAALALFSYGVFGLLALTSVMYLLQLYSLKQHHLRGFFSFLPSILDLDHINLRLLGAGVILMSASLAVGSVYWVHDTSTVHAAKLLTTASVWAAYGAALGLRLRSVLISKRFAWVCLSLFVAALLSLGAVESSRKPLPPTAAISSRP